MIPEQRTVDVELRWRASSMARAIATCAALALAAAALTSTWQLVAFSAPLLGVLVSVWWQCPSPRVRVHADPGTHRCFEAERTRLTVWADADDGSPVDLEIDAPTGLSCESTPRPDGRVELSCVGSRWGRYPISVRVTADARGGLFTGTATVMVSEHFVFPIAPTAGTDMPRTELLDRLGAHITPHIGRGVEFGNIRSYVPGDQLRTVNWPVSARRGSLHVTERLSERAADVVVLVDTADQPPGPATEAAERTVRGAVQVVQSALRSGDRAGVVALGGVARWLAPDIGRRQFYRVLDAVLAAGDGAELTTGTLAPRAAIPSGAVVVAFSTLLDTDFALALIDLCRRGHVVVAVDVLEDAPFVAETDPLIRRMWSMQRAFMYRDMATIGVEVVAWRAESTLDQVMHLVPDHRRRRGGR